MRDMTLPTIRANVVLVGRRVWSLFLLAAIGCANQERASNFQLGDVGGSSATKVTCGTPADGCPCSVPGKMVDCGEVRERAYDYVTCVQGERVCGDNGTWGVCAGDSVKMTASAKGSKFALALGAPESCSDVNPCDPLCRQIVDTGVSITSLPEGLCSTASGLELCSLCGYLGPVSDLPYESMPAEWRRTPATCSTANQDCPFDMVCVDSSCGMRVAPCANSNPGCSVDLTLGMPCFDPANPNTTYHIPLCNRGAAALAGGTIRIGVDSHSENMNACASTTAVPPDSGIIEYTLASGQGLAAGACVDVSARNSRSTGLDLTGSRALLVNYDASLPECSLCNNGSATIARPEDAVYSACTACSNLECAQSSAGTTLRGVVYDPAGRRPLPNVLVYVPNSDIANFVDGVACDTCDSSVSGDPLVWSKSDAMGHFSLPQVPADIEFPVVVQLGRWRRQFKVAAIPSGETRWVRHYDSTSGVTVLTADATEPERWPDPAARLRLPATQRRCTSSGCGGEGDIPKIAVMMGDADPIQCVLWRMGIAPSEFTSVWEDGRVSLHELSGMLSSGSRAGFGAGGLLTERIDGRPILNDFSLLLAPCDTAHDTIGSVQYADTPYASGPSYNSWPDALATDEERGNVKAFVDAGGRLLTTHWLSMDFVHLNYGAPSHASFDANLAVAVPLASLYDPASDSAFTSAMAAYPVTGFNWGVAAPSSYNPTAPALYLFGSNVDSGSNRLDRSSTAPAGNYPALAYKAAETTFATWAAAVGATAPDGSGRVPWQRWSSMVHSVRPDQGVVSFLTGDSSVAAQFLTDVTATRAVPVAQQPCLASSGGAYDCSREDRTWGGEHVAMFQFDAPIGAEQKCGRVAVASGHVSQHACFAPSGGRLDADGNALSHCGNLPPYDAANPAPDCDCFAFPADVATACASRDNMSSEELAFEYLFFSASQCMGELTLPPSARHWATKAFVRDFESDCEQGKSPVWRLFSWQATIPAGTQIAFLATTADSEAELASLPYVSIGVASVTTTTWTANNQTVDSALRESPTSPDVSRKWLRVKMVFSPSGETGPTLAKWRMVYNCVDA